MRTRWITKEAKAAERDAQFRPMADGSAKPLVWAGVAAGLLALVIAVATLFVRNAPAPSRPSCRSLPSVAPAAATAPSVRPPRRDRAGDTSPAAAALHPGRPWPLTSERLAASEEWLKRTPGNRYFIQLMNVEAGAAPEIEAFLSAMPVRWTRSSYGCIDQG